MERNTLEAAEAKFIESLAKLTWIIPVLVVFENLLNYNNVNWSGNSTITIMVWVLIAAVLFKIITVIDRQLNAERELRVKKMKQ